MTERIHNFSAGPAILPVSVLEEAQRDMLSLPGVGMSVMEISHRSKTFDEIMARADSGLRQLLGIHDNYHVLFLQLPKTGISAGHDLVKRFRPMADLHY